MLVRVIELLLLLLGAYLLVTQIMIPGFKGTKLFPMLNPKRNELANAAVEAAEQADIERMTPKPGEDTNASR